MKDILSEIIANKRFEIDVQKNAISEDSLEDLLTNTSPCKSLRNALLASKSGIIAEFKRRSPSKGWIRKEAETKDIIPSYINAGATALSILTDEKFFGGNINDIKSIRHKANIPILRKDFIISTYQIYQAKLIGADVVLLIASVLPFEEYMILLNKAHELKLEVLVEIHNEAELKHIIPDVDIVGINNRHLGSFVTDVQHSFELAHQLPKDVVLISESGISDVQTILRLKEAGFKGFLIGETFMKDKHPEKKLKQFVEKIENGK